MSLTKNAEVTVVAPLLTTVNLGFPTDNLVGATTVSIPQHVAQMLSDLGAVTITTAGG